MAGAPGFEPGNVGTKNRCLTTWRRPNGPGPWAAGSGRDSAFPHCLQWARPRKSSRLGAFGHASASGRRAPPENAIAQANIHGYRSAPARRAGCDIAARPDRNRSVAQPGRALSSGGRGRRFESSHSDHPPSLILAKPKSSNGVVRRPSPTQQKSGA